MLVNTAQVRAQTRQWPQSLRSSLQPALLQRSARPAAQRIRRTPMPCRAAAAALDEVEVRPNTLQGTWKWRGHNIRYQRSGDGPGPAVLLVHGFGGNCDHFRKNTAVLGASGHRAYAIDLLGYGYSDKPDPRRSPPNSIYCFETWGDQIADFLGQVVGGPAVLVCNSVGGLAGLQAALVAPGLVDGVQLLDMSLRGLHVQRQSPLSRPLVSAFQTLLRDTPLGAAFFSSVAQPATVKNILSQAYGDPATVTDELVDCILKPGLQPGATAVFLDFISYSGGPLPEELLARVPASKPVSIVWGEADPWEDVSEAKRLFGSAPCVREFVVLPGVGHCPQDEAPQLVNPLIQRFVASCSGDGGGADAAATVQQSQWQ